MIARTQGAHRVRRHTVAHDSPQHDNTQPGRRRRGGIATAAVMTMAAGAVLGGTFLAASPAGAATSATRANVTYAWQDESTHKLYLRGHAHRSGKKSGAKVDVYVDGKHLHTSTARGSSPTWDKQHHVTGKNGFKSVFAAPAGSHSVRLVAAGHTLATKTIGKRRSAGGYIVSLARKHVGASYRYGSAGPRSFDCSGFAKYVYGKADIQALPHNSNTQRTAGAMHRIKRSSARPGDLVFYLSGKSAYHVAIYAGHGKQYSATNPSRGVEYSKISSSHVVFGTDWH